MSNDSNKKGSGTLQVQIIETMSTTSKPNELWTANEIVEEMGITKIQADNALLNAWKTNKICRHKINANSEGNKVGAGRYAVKIKESDKIFHSVSSLASSASSGPKKRRGQKASARDVRGAFVEMQRALTRLEDMIMPLIESAEEKDKALEKLRSIL